MSSHKGRLLAIRRLTKDNGMDHHRITVTDFIFNFRNACQALVPCLDRARIAWSDANQYDNWDRISEALFESLVAEPCVFQAHEIGLDAPRLTKYGISNAPTANAFIGVVASQGEECRFISLASHDEPFDHVRALGKNGEIIYQWLSVSFHSTGPTGKQFRANKINLQL